MKKLLLLIFAILIRVGTEAQDFSQFLSHLESLPEDQRQSVSDSFLAANPVSPLTEQDTLCHFLYKGEAGTLMLAGDATQWSPMHAFTRVQSTDFWYLSLVYEADARLDYKLVINGSNWILDSRNPYTCSGGFGPNSELRMPAFIPPDEIQYQATVAHGTLRDTVFASIHLSNSRKIWIYTPHESYGDKPLPVVYVHDGDGFLALASMRNVLDNLMAAGRIQPLIAVFVPPVDRTDEYAGAKQAAFTKFMTEELVPYIDHRYNTMPHPWGRANLGASNGGNIALWLCVSHPEMFGLAAAMSSNVEPNIRQQVEQGVVPSVKFYLDLGTYDIPILIDRVRSFRDLLQASEETLYYKEFHEGHSWGNWKAHIDDALIYLFGSIQGAGYLPAPGWDLKYNSMERRFDIGIPEGMKPPFRLSLLSLNGVSHGQAYYTGNETRIEYRHPPLPQGMYVLNLQNRTLSCSHKVLLGTL